MAFLRFRSVYCIPEEDITVKQRHIFGGVCITTAVVSLFGAWVQLKSWYRQIKDYKDRRKPSSNPVIAFCLALADLFTCLGVIAMSILFITMYPPYTVEKFVPQVGKVLNMTDASESWYKYVGIPIEGFTMFSYISSYLWTFGYALDICLQIYNKDTCINLKAYHFVFWLAPAWMVLWGQLGYLYGSDEYCSIRDQQIWHYWVCFAPLVTVFVALPCIYFLAFIKVRDNIKSANCCFTNAERELISAVRNKFFFIWLVFVFCWIANVADGIQDLIDLYSSNNKNEQYVIENKVVFPESDIHFTIWMIEATVNPLQGFLNCLVYYGKTKLIVSCREFFTYQTMSQETLVSTEQSEHFFINSHDNLENADFTPPERSLNYKTIEFNEPPSEKRFKARLLGEPNYT